MKNISLVMIFFFIVSIAQTPDSNKIDTPVLETVKKIVSEKVDSVKSQKLDSLNQTIKSLDEKTLLLDSLSVVLDSLKDDPKVKWKLAPVLLKDVKTITFKDKKPLYLLMYYKQIDGKTVFFRIVPSSTPKKINSKIK